MKLLMFNSPWIRKPDFSKISLKYDDYWKNRGWQINKKLKPREEIILKIIPSGSNVMDIGCGNSLLPLKLKEKGAKVEIADISKLVLDNYLPFGIKGRVLNIENVETLSFDKKFDFIIMSEVLEHTRNPEEIILKLKNNTDRFAITIPNSASYQFRYGLMFRGRFFTQWIMHPSEHLRFWSHIDFLDWLKAMGLEVEKTIVSEGFSFRGFLPWLPRLWKNLLAYRVVYICKVPK